MNQGRVLFRQSIKSDVKSLFNNIDGYQLYYNNVNVVSTDPIFNVRTASSHSTTCV